VAVPAADDDQRVIGTRAADTERETLSRLRRMVDGGGYGEGDKLPPERQLAEDLNVSRRVLRNAFAVLEREGRVWRGVGQGTFVGRRTPKSFADLSLVARTSNPVTLVEARLSFEPVVVRFAAQRVTSAQIQEMKACMQASQGVADRAEFDRLDERLHRMIVAAAQNAVFQAIHEMIGGIWEQLAWGHARERSLTPEWRRVYVRQHRAIIEAIERRDLDRAENLMLEHWQTLRSNLIGDPLGKAGPVPH
jgi:DNA-binding FadR family transcriptional regulator